MKVNDSVPVTIGGHVVAQARVKELGDGTATLVVPATLVVMGTRTDLTDLPSEEPSTETVITGVDRPEPQPVVLENAEGSQTVSVETLEQPPAAAEQPAPVAENIEPVSDVQEP